MAEFFKYIWQLPQNLLGKLVISVTRATQVTDHIWIANVHNKGWSGVSLGKYVIFNDSNYRSIDRMHEYGHQKQSLYLGPLYLIVIGLPSFIGNLLHRKFKFNYYKQPWERWADKLGKVNRV